MVKLFGWEGRVQDYIAHKRGAELDRIWRMKLLTLANNIIKFVALLYQKLLDTN